MIHLSIQDIALLANLAGCCNSVDEFAEYAVRTYGTNSALLSGQDEPAEFIVNFQNLENISLSPTQRQMMAAYNTIKKLQVEPDNISYKIGSTETIDQIRNLVGSKDLADLATMVYAGIYKLKYESTDYKAYLYNTLIFKFIKGPVGLSYSTVDRIVSSSPPTSASLVDDYRALTYTTIDTLRLPRDERPYNILSIDILQQPTGAEIQTYYISPKDIQSRQKLDEMFNYLSPKILYHTRLADSEDVIDSPNSYISSKILYHTQLADSEDTIDSPNSYISSKILYHTRATNSEMPVDSPVAYMSSKILYHTRLADSEDVIDSPNSYISSKILYHTRQTESQLPVDGSGSYASPQTIYHTRQTESENPIDGAGSYASPRTLYHTRQTESQLPVDGPGSYASPQTIYHTRELHRIDGAGSYPAINAIEYHVSERVNLAGSYPTLGNIFDSPVRNSGYVAETLTNVTYAPDREDFLAYTAQSLNLIKYPGARDDNLVSVAQTLQKTKYWKLGDYKAGWVFTMKSTKYWHPDDHVASIAQTLYVVKYPLHNKLSVKFAVSLSKVLYTGTDDIYIQGNQTLSYIHDQIPAYCRTRQLIGVKETKISSNQIYTAAYSTVLGIEAPRIDLPVLSITVRDIALANRLDKTIYSQTIKSVEHKKIESSIDYSTVNLIQHSAGTNVHCDNTEHTWNDYHVDTTVNEYNRATNIYGVSKLRITLFQHYMFDSDAQIDTDGTWRELWTGTIIPALPQEYSAGWAIHESGLVDSNGDWIHNYPIGPGDVAISDIKLYRHNEELYSLSADDIIMETCNCRLSTSPFDKPYTSRGDLMHGIVGTGELSAAIDGRHVLTDTWTDAITGGLVVHNEPLCLTFHLPETVDLKYVDIAPIGMAPDGTPKNWAQSAPGWVHIEGYYPGCRDWFTLAFEHTPNRYLSSTDSGLTPTPGGLDHPWNDMKRTWKPGEYTRFLIVDGERHYRPRRIYNRETSLYDYVYDCNPVMLRCCNNLTTIVGVSGYSLAHDLKPRHGNSLYAVGTAGYG